MTTVEPDRTAMLVCTSSVRTSGSRLNGPGTDRTARPMSRERTPTARPTVSSEMLAVNFSEDPASIGIAVVGREAKYCSVESSTVASLSGRETSYYLVRTTGEFCNNVGLWTTGGAGESPLRATSLP